MSNVNAPLAVHRMADSGLIGYTTHNHPKSSGLSGPDLRMLFFGFGPVAAMGHNGQRHEAAAGPLMAGIDAKVDKPAATHLEAAFTVMLGAIHNELQAKITALPAGEQSAMIAKAKPAETAILSLVLDRMGIIAYKGDAEAVLADAGGNLDRYTDIAFSIGADGIRRAGLSITEIGDRIRDRKAGSSGTDALGQVEAGQPQGNAPDSDGIGGVPDQSLKPGAKPLDDFDATAKSVLDDIFGSDDPAPAASSADTGFDVDAFNKGRAARIAASKEQGNTHLDQVDPSVETMRGKAIYYVHDTKVIGVIRTVANTREVVVHWSDTYSAEKELAVEKVYGKKRVMESWLAPSDLKDYVFGSPSLVKNAKPAKRSDDDIAKDLGKARPHQSPSAPIANLS